jgi:FtsH-binding integral membrane protein
MANNNSRTRGSGQNRSGVRSDVWASDRAGIDEGLRAYMLRVYNLMALGVAVTAISTLVVMNSPVLLGLIVGTPLIWVLFAGVLGLGWFAPRLILSGSVAKAHAAYWTYSMLWGLLIAPMVFSFFQVGAGDLVFRAFLVTAVTFGGASLYGYVTKRDLSGMATFFTMAIIGLLVAIVVNMLVFQSSLFSLITSSLVVLVFSGVTAWETQKIKKSYFAGDSARAATGKAVFGAFILFGSFITIFIHLLSIFGMMRNN